MCVEVHGLARRHLLPAARVLLGRPGIVHRLLSLGQQASNHAQSPSPPLSCSSDANQPGQARQSPLHRRPDSERRETGPNQRKGGPGLGWKWKGDLFSPRGQEAGPCLLGGLAQHQPECWAISAQMVGAVRGSEAGPPGSGVHPLAWHVQITEARLIELLEQVNEQTQHKTTVTIQRRRAFDDDDF